jgi:virginiamycin B lyase
LKNTPTDITVFQVPTANSRPGGITSGRDGNIWFTEYNGNRIGRVNLNHMPIDIDEFEVPTANSGPNSITSGPDGKLWFTEYFASKIGRITTDGNVESEFEFPAGSHGHPANITVGPDNNLWFSEGYPNPAPIGRITLDGVITEFSVPTMENGSGPVTAGPDGNVWFAEQNGNNIGRIGPRGTTDQQIQESIREFSLPTPNSVPLGITAAPDGKLWFVEVRGNKIGYFDPFGTDLQIQQSVREFPIPTANSWPGDITVGPDKNLWFTEWVGLQIGKLYLLSASGTTVDATVGEDLRAVVASFHDDEPGMVAGNYTAQIDWGDQTPPSTGEIFKEEGDGQWIAAGGHTYSAAGSYPVTVTITDTHNATGMTTTATSTVNVTAPAPPPGRSGNPGNEGPLGDVIAGFHELVATRTRPAGHTEGDPFRMASGHDSPARFLWEGPLTEQAQRRHDIESLIAKAALGREDHEPRASLWGWPDAVNFAPVNVSSLQPTPVTC